MSALPKKNHSFAQDTSSAGSPGCIDLLCFVRSELCWVPWEAPVLLCGIKARASFANFTSWGRVKMEKVSWYITLLPLEFQHNSDPYRPPLAALWELLFLENVKLCFCKEPEKLLDIWANFPFSFRRSIALSRKIIRKKEFITEKKIFERLESRGRFKLICFKKNVVLVEF